jgi:hypothetical protein
MLFSLVVAVAGTMSLWIESAGAGPVDCDRLKNSQIPFEIKLRAHGSSYIIQEFRDASGSAIVWTRLLGFGDSVTRAIEYNGFSTESESAHSATTPKGIIVLSHFKVRLRYGGLDPRVFDYSADASFKLYSHVEMADGPSPRDSESQVEYKMLRQEQVAVGDCSFSSTVFVGTRLTDGKESQLYYRYLPELRLRIADSDPDELRIDEIATVFESMKLPAQ